MNDARAETIRLAELLRGEQHAMAEFLVALSAFDRERRWEELGYASLFDFLRRELKLSAGAAQNRKAAAGLIARFPEVETALRRGDLCLSSVNQVAKVLTPENAAEVLPRFFGKSSREAELVAVSIRPVEDPPRRDFLVTAVRASPRLETPGDVTAGAFHAYETTSAPTAPPPAPAQPAPAPDQAPTATIPDRPRIKPLDGERARVNMTVSRRLLDKLAAARDALSHSHPGASEETILELGLDLIIHRHRKRRGIGAKPRKRRLAASGASAPGAASAPAPVAARGQAPAAAAPAFEPAGSAPEVAASAEARFSTTMPPCPPGPSRHVPAAVWRGVWERDQGRCVWPLENGGVCGSTRRIELDHLGGAALGAGTTVDECRLLCRGHNLLHARALYGDAVMNRCTRPRGGPHSSEPVAAYGDTRAGLDEGRGRPGSRLRAAGPRAREDAAAPHGRAPPAPFTLRPPSPHVPGATLGRRVASRPWQPAAVP